MNLKKEFAIDQVDWQNSAQVRRLLLLEETILKKNLREKAMEKALEVARWLKKHYNVGVYLYGSLIWGKFNEHSDIDLLIVGFKDINHYWQMQVKAEEIASPFPVSIVCAEEAVESLKGRVFARGVKIA